MDSEIEQVPWPREWKEGPAAGHVLIGAFLLLLAAGALLGGIGAAASGGRSGAFLLPFSLLLAVIAALPAFAYLRRRDVDTWRLSLARVEPIGTRAVHVGYSRRAAGGHLAVLGLCAAALLGIVVLLPLAPPGDGRALVLWFGSVLLLGWLVWVALAVVRGRAARGWLALAPEGVVHRGWGTTTIAAWDDVASVRADTVKLNAFIVLAVPGGHARRVVHCRAVQAPEDRLRPHLAVRPRMPAVDPAVLYHALCFYHAVPQARSELGDGRAIERMRRCDFAPGPA
ncbi:hypothetical protein FZ103_05190 [Streptomonospora sp. PA3]|uniref:hypothetical protein n=1 Tax=Streptomonospora sp. PA3 TaxID=2607326 RepID=UPI0012DD4414|nr:hypothetical protein [Streptomonospora sp. PA3]MUL40580.1 hypothetical protein [Streptomonospora sp. PA3]